MSGVNEGGEHTGGLGRDAEDAGEACKGLPLLHAVEHPDGAETEDSAPSENTSVGMA